MQLHVSGHHVELTEAMQTYVEKKVERLERHFDHVTNVNVILGVEKTRQKAEATIHITGNDIFAEAEDENMYAAIDALIDKLDRQIKKHKEKVTNHHCAEGAAKKHQAE